MTRVVTDFGQVLRNLRKNVGVTQRTIADAITRSTAYISDVEQGHAPAPKKEVLRKWLAALQCEDRLEELYQLAVLNRTNVWAKLKPNDPSNPAIVKVIEKYNTGKLTDFDRTILSLVE